jgi:hypothetical protein
MENVACLGVKINHNATDKYATTVRAAWNVKFVGLNDKKLAILEILVAEIVNIPSN